MAEEKELKKKITRVPKKTSKKEDGVVKKTKKVIKEEKVEKVEEKERDEKIIITKAPKGYLQAIGRRKEAIVQVRIYRGGSGEILVNGKPAEIYFNERSLIDVIYAPLKAIGQADKLDLTLKASGGGLRGQAEAARLGVSRALIQLNPTFRVSLKRLGYLRRDPRVKERKKYGLKGARRAPQWAKR